PDSYLCAVCYDFSLVGVALYSCCVGDVKDLHSFPTRRSSDLAAVDGQDNGHRPAPGSQITTAFHGASFGRPSLWVPILEAGSSGDRKSTRLNSSHVEISYAVFCMKNTTYASEMTWSIRLRTRY